MKKLEVIYKKSVWMFLIAVAVVVSSCAKTEDMFVDQDGENLSLKSASILTPVITYSIINGVCGIQNQALVAGQNYTAGNVNVSTTPEGKLLISVSTQGGWALKGIHLFVGDKALLPVNKSGNPVPGNFPVKSSFSTFQSAVSYEFNIADFSNCFVIALHANVSKLDEIGQVLQSETAWAAGTRFVAKGSWATYLDYCAVPCSPPANKVNECTEWKTDTAWGGTAAGAGNAWWFFYTGGGSQTIWAGQSKEAGTVVVANGVATITLNPGWELQPGSESVKIQGYNTLPSARPAAGQFTTYKGTELVVTVGNFTYYAIHIDVQKCLNFE